MNDEELCQKTNAFAQTFPTMSAIFWDPFITC